MKIPLQVYFFAGGLRAIARFLLQSKEPHIFGSIEAIVDTGSPATILGMPDIKRMRVSQIQLKNLESRKEPMAYGGGQIKTKILQEAKLKFGEDFMEKNKLKLIFNPAKKEAYFESSE